MTSVVIEAPERPVYLNSFCFILRPRGTSIMYPRFASHLFRSRSVRRQVTKAASGVTRFNLSKARLAKVRIPVPPMESQIAVASILDEMDVLANDLSRGLPAEIAARRRQYEYYRDKLLTFPQERS